MIHPDRYPEDPDHTPYIEPAILRDATRPRRPRNADNMELAFAMEYAEEEKIAMHSAMGRTGVMAAMQDTRQSWDAIVTTPVAVLYESPELAYNLVDSIGNAANYLNKPTLFMPWLDFMADQRREADRVMRAMSNIEEIREAILDCAIGFESLKTTIAIDHLPARVTTMPAIRQRMFLGALGCTLAMKDAKKLLQIPYMSIDFDTVVSVGALREAKEVLDNDKALFVSGNLYYESSLIGGLNEVSKEEKLLHVAEYLRRVMFNHLPPTAPRGYLPEAAMATKLATLSELGGFNAIAENNESYWLERAALQAIERFRRMQQMKHPPVQEAGGSFYEPLIPDFKVKRLDCITWYGDFDIYTDFTGIIEQVAENGIGAVVGFDQGEHYTMRTTQYETKGKIRDSSSLEKTADVDIRNILDATYTYYVKRGGQLTSDGLLGINKVIRRLKILTPNDTNPWKPTLTMENQNEEERDISR